MTASTGGRARRSAAHPVRLDRRLGSEAPRASVVVAVRGNPAALPGVVAAVDRQTLPPDRIELIVVDNHRRPVVTEAAFLDVRVPVLLLHEPALGLSRARNAGILRARGDYVLVTDADSRPRPDWAERLVDALAVTGASCGGGRAVPVMSGTPRHPLARALLPWFVPPEWPAVTTELRSPYWLVGCNLAFRRTEPPTLFAEQLGAVGRRHRSCEDLEIVARYEERGERVVVVPGAIVDRAIHPADLRTRAITARALWHGVSIARLARMRPSFEVYDSYQVRDVIGTAAGGLASVAGLCRITGYHLERMRLAATSDRPPDPASGSPGTPGDRRGVWSGP